VVAGGHLPDEPGCPHHDADGDLDSAAPGTTAVGAASSTLEPASGSASIPNFSTLSEGARDPYVWDKDSLGDDPLGDDPLDKQLVWELLAGLVACPSKPRSPSKTRQLITTNTFDIRRQALRARANELSRSRIRHLKVTDLPLEILRLIFNDLQEPAVKHGKRVVDWISYDLSESHERPQAVRNARLVCRLFCELATPLMFPVLRLQISQSSLDLAHKISERPLIAAGVRDIQVSLGYRPEDMADDVARFCDARLTGLQELQDLCYAEMNRREERRKILGDSAVDEERLADLDQAVFNMDCLRSEWLDYMGIASLSESDGDSLSSEEPIAEYEELLLTSQCEFARLHEEQDRLLHDWTFVSTLVSAIRRMGNVRSLHFTDTMAPQQLGHDIPDNYILPLIDTSRLTQFLVAPLTWEAIESASLRPTEIAPAKLLWQLPIALHEAGVSLHELKIDVVPLHTSVLCPSYPTPTTNNGANGLTPWQKLARACASLGLFELLGRNLATVGYKKMSPEDRTNLRRFLSAVLASCARRGLHTLILDFIPFVPSGISDCEPPGVIQRSLFPAFALVNALPPAMPKLRKLLVSGVKLDQPRLEALCGWPGDQLESLSLARVALRRGERWADSLDILREKLGEEKNGKKAKWCYLETLVGGGFKIQNMYDMEEDWDREGPDCEDGEQGWRAWWPTREGLTGDNDELYGLLIWPHMGCHAVSYIVGNRVDNPLRSIVEDE